LQNGNRKVKAASGGLAVLLIGLLCLICYLNTLPNEFVFDDEFQIVGNEMLRGGRELIGILGIVGRLQYRPVRIISYNLDYQFSGLNPLGYHISNIAYHFLAAVFAYLVAHLLLKDRRAALLTGLLFAAHPAQSEAVAYLSGRKDVLAGCFFLIALYFFLREREGRGISYFFGSFGAYLLAIFTKEIAVTLPVIFLAYDLGRHIPAGHRRKRGLFRGIIFSLGEIFSRHRYQYLLLVSTATVFSYYTIFVSKVSGKLTPPAEPGAPATAPSLDIWWGENLFSHLQTSFRVVAEYLKIMIWPVRLIADYSFDAFPLSGPGIELRALLALAIVLAVALGAILLLSRHQLYAFGGIWLLVTLLPVAQIVPHHELLAERNLYLPCFGVCLLFSLLVRKGLGSRALGVLLLALMVFFTLRITARNTDWKNNLALWIKTTSQVPDCARAQFGLGLAYQDLGLTAEAIAGYRRAVEIVPGDPKFHNNLGSAYEEAGQLEEAIREYWRAVELSPGFFKAYNNLGLVYFKMGLFPEAVAAISKAEGLRPDSAKVHTNLGVVYLKGLKDDRKALEHFQEALRLAPDHPQARLIRKRIEVLKSRIAE
jgi:tetratricopeptide (TPR) repeat protein